MLPPFLQHLRDQGYVVFEHGSFNLNLVGIRSPARVAGKFDDWITCWYKDSNGAWQNHWWPATTDPGTFWLQHPMKRAGCAIVAEGQHPRLWKIGLHKNYRALEQVGNITVYRDGDLDNVIDIGVGDDYSDLGLLKQSGDFSINCHASDSDPWDKHDRSRIDGDVGKWSAGCQVLAVSSHFRQLVTLCEQSTALGFGTTFTYTLIRQERAFRMAA